MNIQCPACGENNSFPTSKPIQCQHCSKPISGTHYDKKSGSVIKGLIVVAIGGSIVTNSYFKKDDRYSLHTEYAIVQSCISQSQKPLDKSQFRRKIEVCVCALSTTQKTFDSDKYEIGSSEFIASFKQSAGTCTK
ncbi:MAG: hypothetical protein JKY17_05550 [Magnetovibrio sp.]|nr:hypothetical protein [Magnetovibrio sp.]